MGPGVQGRENVHARWADDAFLDGLRLQGDAFADACFAALTHNMDGTGFAGLFRQLNANDRPLPDDVPVPLRNYLAAAQRLPLVDGKEVDRERLRRGQQVFMRHLFPATMMLLAKALPEGYASPGLSKILDLSDNISKRPYRRLLGVLQMIVNVCAVGGFETGGKALVTIPKVRLLHAGVRHVVRKHMPEFEPRYGVPVNLEDMLATMMGFSLLVVDGLKTLRIDLSDAQCEDYFYLWRVCAQMSGLHPKDEPDSSAFMPENLHAARTFYAAYCKRNMVPAAENPEGVRLARSTLAMWNDVLLPQTPLRRLGFKVVPRVYMEELIGRERCLAVGVRPVRFLLVTKWGLKRLPVVWTKLWRTADRFDRSASFHDNVSRMFLQRLIVREFGDEVTFMVPDSLEALQQLAQGEGN